MKRPIGWHEECLANHGRWLMGRRRSIAVLQRELAVSEHRYRFLERQIEEARKRGITEFDCERLLVPRGGRKDFAS